MSDAEPLGLWTREVDGQTTEVIDAVQAVNARQRGFRPPEKATKIKPTEPAETPDEPDKRDPAEKPDPTTKADAKTK